MLLLTFGICLRDFAGRGLRRRNPHWRNRRWQCRTPKSIWCSRSIHAASVLPSQRFPPKPTSSGMRIERDRLIEGCDQVKQAARERGRGFERGDLCGALIRRCSLGLVGPSDFQARRRFRREVGRKGPARQPERHLSGRARLPPCADRWEPDAESQGQSPLRGTWLRARGRCKRRRIAWWPASPG